MRSSSRQSAALLNHVFNGDPNDRNIQETNLDVSKCQNSAYRVLTMFAILLNGMFGALQSLLIDLRLSRSQRGPCLPQTHLWICWEGPNVCKHRLRAISSASNNGMLCIRQHRRSLRFCQSQPLRGMEEALVDGPRPISRTLDPSQYQSGLPELRPTMRVLPSISLHWGV